MLRTATSIALIIAAMLTTTAQAAVIMTHNGSTDPLNEGWEGTNADGDALPNGVTAGPIDDNGTAAWYVDDNSAYRYGMYRYQYFMDSSDVLDGLNNGWSMDVTLRVVDVPDIVDASILTAVSYDNIVFSMQFGSQDDGDPILRLGNTGPALNLEGIGGGYHDYSMIFDPDLQSAAIFVDGNEVMTGYTGEYYSLSVKRLAWGSISSLDKGHGNFSKVSFAIPEPSSMAITILSAGGFILIRRRFC